MRHTRSVRGIVSVLTASGIIWTAGCSTQGADSTDADDESASSQGLTGPYAGSPYLGELRNEVLYGDVWERPQLSKRDRSMVTIAFLQALDRQEVRGHIARGLDNGLTSQEISEIILHATFYAGWPTGVNASRMAAEVFQERGAPRRSVGGFLATPLPATAPVHFGGLCRGTEARRA